VRERIIETLGWVIPFVGMLALVLLAATR